MWKLLNALNHLLCAEHNISVVQMHEHSHVHLTHLVCFALTLVKVLFARDSSKCC